MAILDIDGIKVEVDDGFFDMTPEDQEATVDEIADSLAAGRPSSEEERSGGIGGAVRAVGRGVLGIGSYLDELDAATNATLVRGMLNINNSDQISNEPAVLFQVRQAVDGMLDGEQNSKVVNALMDARQMLDDALTDSVPRIKEIDAAYHELSRQSEGLGMGRPILNNEATAMRPVELEDALAAGADPNGMLIGPSGMSTRMRQGALGEIYRAIGTKANDTTALRNIVRGEGDWNRDKLAMLFGDKPADNALRAIDRETVFGDTANRVTRGSDTAMASGFERYLNEIAKSQEVPTDTTLTGLGTRGIRAVARAMMQRNAQGNVNELAEQLGGLSVAQGDARDQIIEAILRRGQENVVDQQRMALINALMKSGGYAGYQSLPGVR